MGLRPWFGLWPSVAGRARTGGTAQKSFLRYGGAQPRLTSGGVADSRGEAAMKIAEGRRRQTATVKTSA